MGMAEIKSECVLSSLSVRDFVRASLLGRYYIGHCRGAADQVKYYCIGRGRGGDGERFRSVKVNSLFRKSEPRRVNTFYDFALYNSSSLIKSGNIISIS